MCQRQQQGRVGGRVADAVNEQVGAVAERGEQLAGVAALGRDEPASGGPNSAGR